jgi:hypothetical protein
MVTGKNGVREREERIKGVRDGALERSENGVD